VEWQAAEIEPETAAEEGSLVREGRAEQPARPGLSSRHRFRVRRSTESPLAERVIVALATACEVSTGMEQVVTILREDSRAARVE
jgi:hypothetical protein